MNLVSYVSQQRVSPWLDVFGIFHNNSYLLELRGAWYLANEYVILLRNYTQAFSPRPTRCVRFTFMLGIKKKRTENKTKQNKQTNKQKVQKQQQNNWIWLSYFLRK